MKKWPKNKNFKKPGFFIEAGASTGEQISNSIYFELKHKWTGLLVEPNPDFLKMLKPKNRKVWILPHCLSTSQTVELVDFEAAEFNGGIIKNGKTLPSNLGRQTFGKPKRPNDRNIKVQCFPLQAVLEALNLPKIDYFSLDIEGAEFPVLQNLNWNKIHISSLSVEINHAGEIFDGTREDIYELMLTNGFEWFNLVGFDDIYAKK